MYEQTVKVDYYNAVANGACLSAAQSDGFKATQMLPEENALVLENGRRVEYEHLVVATG